jgi:ribonuclease HII
MSSNNLNDAELLVKKSKTPKPTKLTKPLFKSSNILNAAGTAASLNIISDGNLNTDKIVSNAQSSGKTPDDELIVNKLKVKSFKENAIPLAPCHSQDTAFEIGIDEAGRGPLFGPVFVAAVVLPKDSEKFNHKWMRDSKKIKSKKTMTELANYIKQNALYWHVDSADAETIDRHNILSSVMTCMHNCVTGVVAKMRNGGKSVADGLLLVDGNHFKPYVKYDESTDDFFSIQHTTVEKGDGTYSSIAAASILAKEAHDAYIAGMCSKYPALCERYSLDKNVGYGTKAHIDGIKLHGVTQWHRKSFNICRGEKENPVE